MQSQTMPKEVFLICLSYQTLYPCEREKSDGAGRQAGLWREELISPQAKDSGTPPPAGLESGLSTDCSQLWSGTGFLFLSTISSSIRNLCFK